MKRLAIIGTKEYSQQILSCAESTKIYECVGYLDDLISKGTLINGKPVLGTVEESVYLFNKGEFDCVFIAVGYTRFDLREQFYNIVKGKIPLANIIMPSAEVSESAILGEGVFIGNRAIIGKDCVIEDNVCLLDDSYIGHDNKIGKHTYMSGRINTAGYCSVGQRCFVGICVILSDHITICDDVWLGLGCIVIKSIKESGKYMSPSAKLFKIE